MKKFKFSLVVLAGIVMMTSFTQSSYSEKYSLTISVDDLKNSDGLVQFTLYNKGGTIPDENYENYYLQQTNVIVKNKSSITFDNLSSGTYAINVLHDEDMNGKIKKGFVLPVEGIGFSNFTSIGLMNRPNFEKASFELNTDLHKIIKIIYL